MFQSGEEFDYFECADCGAIQICAVPSDMSPYYAGEYYAHAPQGPLTPDADRAPSWRERTMFGSGLLARVLCEPLLVDRRLASIARTRPLPQTKILDVGSGSGDLLRRLRRLGFENLTGIDPFVAHDTLDGPGMRILRRSLDTFEETGFDLVTLHHVLEHLADHEGALGRAFRALRPGGLCIVRTPVADCHARDRYGAHWIDFDAPRHIVVHTRRSLRRLIARTPFEVVAEYDDAHFLQFLGSSLYRRGQPLRRGSELGALGKVRKAWYELASYYFNKRHRGAWVALILRRPPKAE